MKLDREGLLALIAKVQKNGDITAIHTLYDFYREKFEAAAMYHFNRHPFDYEMAMLRNDDPQKQWFVFGAAYEAFDRTCRKYNPSACSFETWMNHEIEWLFMEKSEKAGERYYAEAETQRCNNGQNISIGGYVRCGKATVWRQFDTDNYEPDLLEDSYAEMMDAVLRAVPEECATHRTIETTLQTYVEGFENQSEAAKRLEMSQQGVSKGCKSAMKWIPEILQKKIREKMKG